MSLSIPLHPKKEKDHLLKEPQVDNGCKIGHIEVRSTKTRAPASVKVFSVKTWKSQKRKVLSSSHFEGARSVQFQLDRKVGGRDFGDQSVARRSF